MSPELDFEELRISVGRLRLSWEYIGEGHSGDYDPSDPQDQQLLRFYVEWLTVNDGWQELDDASYCTCLTVGTDRGDLCRYAVDILHSISPDGDRPSNYKKTMELWSWLGTDNPENLPNHQKGIA